MLHVAKDSIEWCQHYVLKSSMGLLGCRKLDHFCLQTRGYSFGHLIQQLIIVFCLWYTRQTQSHLNTNVSLTLLSVSFQNNLDFANFSVTSLNISSSLMSLSVICYAGQRLLPLAFPAQCLRPPSKLLKRPSTNISMQNRLAQKDLYFETKLMWFNSRTSPVQYIYQLSGCRS